MKLRSTRARSGTTNSASPTPAEACNAEPIAMMATANAMLDGSSGCSIIVGAWLTSFHQAHQDAACDVLVVLSCFLSGRLDLLAAKPHRQHVAFGGILPARG